MHQILLKRCLLLFLLAGFGFAAAQPTALDQPASATLEEGFELYEKGQYATAILWLGQGLKNAPAHPLAERAQCLVAVAALKLRHADALAQVQDFIDRHPASPYALEARKALGQHFYETQEYQQAIPHLKASLPKGVASVADVEATYRLAYSYFATKQYKQARPLFAKINRGLHPYSAPASYYSGYLAYLDGDYDAALEDFERASRDQTYAKETDVLIPSVYYKQQAYNKVAAFVKKFEASGKPMLPGLSLLAGEVYFKVPNYPQAYTYLLRYAEQEKGPIERGVHYRLGFSALQTGNKEQAIRYLGKAADGDDELAQVAAYHLGLTYISAGKKDFADIAFDKARKLKHSPELQEKSAFYYVKVNYDNSNYSNVVTGSQAYLDGFPEGAYREEVYALQSDALVHTGNYAKALEVLRAIKNKSNKVKANIQLIAFNQGAQLYNDGQYKEAVSALKLSNDYPMDKELASTSSLWLGEIHALGNKYELAEVFYKQVLPQFAAYTEALYGLGYCYYNMKAYDKAQARFKEYLERPGNAQEEQKTDAILRLADCHYVAKDYANAIALYNTAERRRTPAMDYLLYQRAMAQVGAGSLNAAVRDLQRVPNDFPESKELDRVYYALGDVMFDNGRMDDAIRFLTQFIQLFETHPQLADVYVKRAQTYHLVGQTDAALADCRWVIDHQPASRAGETAMRTMIEIRKMNYPVPDFALYERKFLKANPESSVAVEAAFGMASKPFNDEEYELAVQTLGEFTRRYSQSEFAGEAYYKLGLSYEYLKNAVGAIESYKRVDGGYLPKALKSAGDLELEHGRAADAVTTFLHLKRIATTKRYEEFSTEGLMKAYLGINDYEASLGYADQIIREQLSRYINTAYLFKGKAYHQMKNYDQALQYYNMTTQQSPGKEGAEAQYLIGVMLRDQRQYDASTEALIKVRTQYEAYTDWIYKAFLLIADNYIAIDNTFQAKATLQSIIDNSADPAVVAQAQEKLASLP
jgi:tetratricopeptide (TPR) repeat protein